MGRRQTSQGRSQVYRQFNDQEYYKEKILPAYCCAINLRRIKELREWELLEDGDPSHGIRIPGLAQELRDQYCIKNHQHPAQSPDLNPIEGVWLILKERVRKRVWRTLEELKEVVQDEWAKIDQSEIRKRIDEMPERCRRLIESNGARLRSNIW